MSDYKRLTDEDWLTTISVDDTNDAKLIEYAFRLWQLENQIKNGTLVELPCKVGDTIYYIDRYRQPPRIKEYKVYGFDIDSKSGVCIAVDYGIFVPKNEIFLTKAEAEAKLEELKRGAK